MARWGILSALFFAQSVVGFFNVQQAIELAGFAAMKRPSQERRQMTAGIITGQPIACRL
jgi:heme/copper-type cytochrome/quinol oxidase subunit 4